MFVKVKNFMGIEKAELDVSQIALVAGHNHQGKSSLCRGFAAALSGVTVPLGLRKTEAGMLVRLGTAKGETEITTQSGSALVTWPKAERHTEGTPPFASEFAAGSKFFPDLNVKNAIDLLTDLMGAVPTRDDLKIALDGMSDKIIDSVWATIDRDGWELANKRGVEKGKEYKSQWKYVTKDNYGTKIAASWVPNKWDDLLAGKSQESLDSNMTACRAELEDAISQQAIAGEELNRLQASADLLEPSTEAINTHQASIEAIGAELATLDEHRAQLPAADNREPLVCPHCAEPVVIDKVFKGETILKKAEPIDPKEIRRRGLDLASADGKCGNARDRLNEAKKLLSQAEQEVTAANQATKKLAEVTGKKGESVDIDARRNALQKATDNAEAFQAKMEADRLHNNVLLNQKIIDALDQKGVRKTVLMKALDSFNKQLAHICEIAGWAEILVTPDMVCEFAGRPYVLLAESEQYLVKTTIQMLIADLDGSEAIIIDGADILLPNYRKCLLKVVHKKQRKALITMSMSSIDNAPDLAAMGVGVSYWLENGITTAKTSEKV